ncbi:MAG: hypothetical protein ACK6EB_09855, partial [Planctomyces sp.]
AGFPLVPGQNFVLPVAAEEVGGFQERSSSLKPSAVSDSVVLNAGRLSAAVARVLSAGRSARTVFHLGWCFW